MVKLLKFLFLILSFSSCSTIGDRALNRNIASKLNNGSCLETTSSLIRKHKYPVEELLWEFFDLSRKEYSQDEFLRNNSIVSEAYNQLNPDAPKINFEKNLERLLSRLSSEERRAVYDSLKKTRLNHRGPLSILKDRFPQGGWFLSKKGLITIEIPDQLIGSDLDYFIRLHEAYHLIISIVSNERLSKKVKWKFWDVGEKIRSTYFEEMGAMAQEWYFIANMPLKQREEFLDLIENSESLDDSLKSLIKSSVEDFSDTPTSYVIKQHLNKRYDNKSISHTFRINRDMKLLLGLTVPGFTGLLWTLKCVEFKKDPEMEPLFSKYCTL